MPLFTSLLEEVFSETQHSPGPIDLCDRGQVKAERLRTARALALKEATDRYRHELMDHEERLLVLERIKRLRKSLAS